MDQRPKDEPADGGFPVIATDESSVVDRMAKKRRLPWFSVLLVIVGVIIVFVVGLVLLNQAGVPKSLFVEGEKALFAEVHTPLVVGLGNKSFKGKATYTLDDGPEGCTIAQDGTLRWTPERGGEFTLQVSATELGDSDRKEAGQWTIFVDAPNRPPEITPIAAQSVQQGQTLELQIEAVDPDTPKRKLEYRLLKGSPKGAKIDAKRGLFSWTPQTIPPGGEAQVRIAVIEAVPGGLGAKQTFSVRVTPREETPVVVEKKPVEKESTAPVEPTAPTPEELAAAEREKLAAELLELYDEKQVFLPKTYPKFRRIYARQFELDHADSIDAAYGEDRETMDKWFEAHPEIKEEFYIAIDPEADNFDQTLKIFTELAKRFPKSFPTYAEVAIATAVTWDAGPDAFGCKGPQKNLGCTLPPGQLDGIGNFEYLSHSEMVLGRRIRAMPWEFLIHVVNHQTPVAERRWAVTNYLDKQVGIGKCYKDVPYDGELLKHGRENAKIKGHDYSLPSLRKYGGICGHQADFASRVGKSLGVPAISTGGPSRHLGRHAWVMWVELLNVTQNSIQFEIKSYGRYRGDKYYVGSLTDPQTRKRITDRQLELRLHNIGFGVRNKRQAELIMRTYPLYCEARSLDVDARLRFLGEVIRLSPGTESAWLEVARMSRDHEITAKDNRLMKVVFDQFFKTFANFPDFTWTIFDDLIAYRDDPKEAAALYERLITMYLQAKRPDLGCEAVLRYADLVSEQGWNDRAMDALAMMILAFPDDGRYVPEMLDRLEAFVDASVETAKKKSEIKRMRQKLVAFYKELIPKVPKYRGDDLTKYCEKMYQRAIRFFEASGEPQAAAMLQAELSRLQAERDAKKQD